ncbi:MAG: hypothetical protein A4E19_13100 [Nitrospira sp. SG-bin1]|nr:MAG: hypothetical protein A4E19_13100 [Nitrospira sp. SG-bin1]
MRSFKQVFFNTSLVVLSVMAAALFCELVLRMTGFATPGNFNIPRTGLYPRFYFEGDLINGYDISKNFTGDSFSLPDYIHTYGAPFTVTSNSVGCRDRSFDQEDGYVLLIGDSATWGYVELEQTWGATLEQLIGVRVLKCGVSGYGPRQERHKLETVVRRAGRPRFVIVGYVMNDLLDDYLFPARTVMDGYMVNKVVLASVMRGGRRVRSDEELRARLKRFLEPNTIDIIDRAKVWLTAHSTLYDLLSKAEVPLRRVVTDLGLTKPPPPLSEVEAYRSITEFPWLKHAWEGHLDNLRQLNSAVEAVGATMLVVIFPDNSQVYESMRPRERNLQWEYPNQRLAEFFQQEHIAFIDLLPEFRRYADCAGSSRANPQDLYWAHDPHLNAAGNHLAGLLITRRVLEGSFVEVDDKRTRLSTVNQSLNAERGCEFSGSSP